MSGWRIAFAAGDARLIAALGKVKTNLDSGVFMPIQVAAVEAMKNCEHFAASISEVYRERRDILISALERAGVGIPQAPRATFYVWGKIPGDLGSAAFSERLLSECGILTAPGVAFGRHGEGYIRFSLTLPTERVREAADRLLSTSL